jgi:hypothetical protein
VAIGTVIVVLVLLLLLLPIVLGVRKNHRWKVAAGRVESLHTAAKTSDVNRLRELGISPDVQDKDGYTALHLAYYRGEQDAIDALIEFGADVNLRTKEGLSPEEMAEVATSERLLRKGVSCLGDFGDWTDVERGRTCYDRLKQIDPRIYNPALVRCVLNVTYRRTLLHLAIKLGVRGSEQRLAQVLRGYGDKRMATDYLNAGSETLRVAAEGWARRNNYRIYRTAGRSPVSWGRF